MEQIVFDQFYSDYDSWYNTSMGSFVDTIETNTAFSLLSPQPSEKVLDIGCGTGNFSLKLADKGCFVTGIDISKNMLSVAQEKAKKHKNSPLFQEMSCYHLEFEDHSFDKVFSMAAFEFIENPQQAYQEMKRVLKPNGVLVIGTIQKGGSWYDLYTSDVFAETAYAQACFKTKEDLIALDPKAVVSVEECLYTPPTLAEDAYSTLDTEVKYKEHVKVGGFVCVKFQKK